MKILFVSQYFMPEMGAPAVRTYDHCRRWVDEGHKVTVITAVPNHPVGNIYPGYSNSLWQWEDMDGIEVLRVLTYTTPNKGTIRRSIQYVIFLIAAFLGSFGIEKPDIVVGTSPQFLAALAAWAIAFVKGVPFVFEVRDLWPDFILAVGAFRNPVIIGFLSFLERFLYNQADHIVVLTRSFRDRIVEKGVLPSKISVVTNSVDIELFSPESSGGDIRESLGLNGKFVVSYIGTHGMAHGLETVLEAAHILRDDNRFCFVFVGEGAEKERLKQKRGALRLKNIVFVDRQGRDRVPLWLAMSDLHLVNLSPNPLSKTVLPSKIFESMGMAKPMVVAVDGEARKLVECIGAGVYVSPGDPEALARVVVELAADPDRLSEYGRRGREAAVSVYNRDLLAADLLSILARIVTCRHPVASEREQSVSGEERSAVETTGD